MTARRGAGRYGSAERRRAVAAYLNDERVMRCSIHRSRFELSAIGTLRCAGCVAAAREKVRAVVLAGRKS